MIDYDLIEKTGKPFVFFLHGWGGSKESFYLVKNHIAEKCNMVFVSFSGFGKSEEPQLPFKLDDYVDELYNLIKQVAKNDNIVIVCHSFGARIAIKLITKYPNLVSKLMIVDGAGIKPKRKLNYYFNVYRYKKLKKKVIKGALPNSVLEKFGSDDYKKLSKIMKQTFVNIVNEDLKGCLKFIGCKTILLWGQNDTETPLYMAKIMKRIIPNSRLFIIKNAGHFSYIDDKLTFIELLRGLLQE